MFKPTWFFALAMLASFPLSVSAQFTRVISDKRTIEIRATEKVSVPAEVATVKVGYQNEAATKNEAFEENKNVAAKVIQALLAAKVAKEAIETQAISLEREEQFNNGIPSKSPNFTAKQGWHIRVNAADAQRVVDITVGAGANVVDDVEWSVSDPNALEAKAYAAAIARAKAIAETTASQAGVKLGDIQSISNAANYSTVTVNAQSVSSVAGEYTRTTPLNFVASAD